MKKAALIKILAVNDEPSVLNSLRRIFEEADCIFVTAGAGVELSSVYYSRFTTKF